MKFLVYDKRFSYCSLYLAFDVIMSFAKSVLQPPTQQVHNLTITMVKQCSGLMSDAKFKKNTVSLHGILPTHVYNNFKTYRNWRFLIFHVYLKMARDNG